MSKDKEIAKLLAEVESEQIKELQDTNIRLLKRIDELRSKEEQYVEALEVAVLDNFRNLSLPKITVPPYSKKRGAKEICVPILSDVQLSKVTPTYNSEIAEERVLLYADKIIKLARLHKATTPVDKCVVLAVGDIIEGELIFPGQAHEIDSSLYRQVTVDGPRIFYNFFAKLLKEFKEVEVVWVIGNHGALGGRSRRDYNPETNADRMLGRILETMFANEKRIKFASTC